LDGFVAAHAGGSGTKELLTKPLRFAGTKLELNFSTSAAGSVRVELQSLEGAPLPGFELEDCVPIQGDRIAGVVRWVEAGSDVSSLAGAALRILFVLCDADLFSYAFCHVL
jgi:hypothetical protein